jgi:hypothetical protein|tara:strand:- start:588 stop:761 length:174 start_codon:yes stop_codon:yes gene_type:complete
MRSSVKSIDDAPNDQQEEINEDVNRMVLGLRQRLRTGKLMSFKEWIKDVKDLLDLLN